LVALSDKLNILRQ